MPVFDQLIKSIAGRISFLVNGLKIIALYFTKGFERGHTLDKYISINRVILILRAEFPSGKNVSFEGFSSSVFAVL